MTTGYISLTHLISAKIMADKAQIDTMRIQDLISSDIDSPAKRHAAEGSRYYDAEHDILSFRPTYFLDGVEYQDLQKSNIRVPHPFHKIMVDQKVAYILGNPLVISIAEPDVEDPQNPTPEEIAAQDEAQAFEDALLDRIDNEFDDVMAEWAKGASNKGSEWIHFYYDGEGKLHHVLVPGEQIIGVYDTQYQDRLIYAIRYYVYDIVGEDGQIHQRYKVEWWSKDSVEYFQQQLDGTYVHDPFYEVNPGPHWFSFNTANPDLKVSHGWGRVPFVRLDNNASGKTDLQPIKPLIDAYDKVKSGWVNDLVDLQEMVLVLKGYAPMNDEIKNGLSEFAAFLQNLKTHKVISVSNEGGVEPLRVEIPIEAKEKFLQLTRKEIFFFGEGVDVDSEKFQNPSGISLKFLYTSLDLKANRMIRRMKSALSEFMWFLVQDINDADGAEYDSTEIIFTFNKAVIFNEKEKIDSLVASEAMLSKQTILENHPYVDDVEQEMARLDAEEQERIDKGVVDLGVGIPGEQMPPNPAVQQTQQGITQTTSDGTAAPPIPAKKNAKPKPGAKVAA
jgi:SPP1 family phage portal protein